MWRRVSSVLASLSLTACVTAATPSTRPAAFSKAGRDVITAGEIVAARVTDAYQAVIQLRPEFLRRRPVSLAAYRGSIPIAVYLDGLPFGGLESLRAIPLERVRLIRYVTPYDADLRWGGTHPAGAILVTTLK
jgi:hypothetical protein